MRFKDQFRFVRQNMKKNKSRVFMTVLATAMGCAFLIVLASVGFGLQESVVSDVTEGRLLTEISVHGKMVDDAYQELTDEDVAYLESLENVQAVTRRQMVEQNVQFHLGDQEGHGRPVVVHLPSEVESGFELSAGSMPENKDEIIVGYHFYEAFGQPDEDTEEDEQKMSSALLGETVEMEIRQYFDEEEQMQNIPLEIVGIGKAPTREWMYDQDVFISEETLAEIEDFTETPLGRLHDPNMSEDVRQDMEERDKEREQAGGRTYQAVNVYTHTVEDVQSVVDQMDEQDYATHSIVNELEQINTIFLIMKIGLIFVGSIAILIASIGIYNTMTMAVTERSQDIGIMKAIGAHPSAIKRIFLIESTYIGLLGALIGTMVAYAISYTVNLLLPWVIESLLDATPPESLQFSSVPLILTVICVSISVGVAILSGLRPAKRATQVDVLKAMRRDI